MNVAIPFEIKCEIKSSYVQGTGNDVTEKLPCKIIGVSTYLDQPITFHALIEDSYLYSNLPISAFVSTNRKIENPNQYSLAELSHLMNCPAYEIDPFVLPSLSECAVYFKGDKTWSKGKYIMSFDFYTDNELLHLLELDNGQYSLSPNHKCNWSGNGFLPSYEKQRDLGS